MNAVARRTEKFGELLLVKAAGASISSTMLRRVAKIKARSIIDDNIFKYIFYF